MTDPVDLAMMIDSTAIPAHPEGVTLLEREILRYLERFARLEAIALELDLEDAIAMPGIRVLARRWGVTHAGVAAALARLEAAGRIRLEEEGDNRRARVWRVVGGES